MAQRISVQEYNNSDYTKQALKELNEQLKDFQFKKGRKSDEDSTNYSDDDEECDDTQTKSVLIVHPGKKRKMVVDKSDEYLQSLQSRVEQLQRALRKQGDELDTAEIRLYQTRLDLSNASVELESQKQQVNTSRIVISDLNKNLWRTRAKYCCSLALNIAFAYYMATS